MDKLSKIDMGLKPKEIVKELDRFIVGQINAKKAVAIALRNRYRRKNVPEEIREEIVPKNILMIGPTGVGKTEISRRLSKLANAPFTKVEATKFTEVGYVGRDVESIIRDLVDAALHKLRQEAEKNCEGLAKIHAYERVLDAIVGSSASTETREQFRVKLNKGELDDKEVEIKISVPPKQGGMNMEIPGMPGSAMGILNISEMFSKALGNEKTKQKKMKVSEALKILTEEEVEKLIDKDKLIQLALESSEKDGIVFIDEIDKIVQTSKGSSGQVNREGVQRDLLPLIEGTSVNTKYGTIKTDHILFIASGAFHIANPSDLLPELQGRLPIRVELNHLSKEDIIKILTEPENNLIKQYTAMIATEGVDIKFTDSAKEAIAELVIKFNKEIENIGARRLYTIMEKITEEISYEAPDMKKQTITIDKDFVNDKLNGIFKSTDLTNFIL